MRIIIVGGGIGGLALGLGLRRHGIEFEIYERAPEIREVGAGITIQANAVRALRSLGVDETIVARGSIVDVTRLLASNGTVLSTVSRNR